MRNIELIVVHCSDSGFGDAAVIRKWHTDPKPRGNGWDDIGYHAVILNGYRETTRVWDAQLDGVIEPGRPQDINGAHVRGHNRESLGVCLIGVDSFSNRQFDSLRNLLDVWRALYKIPDHGIVGHRDLDSRKTCPNFDVARWYSQG